MHVQVTQSITRKLLVAALAFYIIFHEAIRIGLADVTQAHGTYAQCDS